MMTLKQQLKNVLPVTVLENKGNYGTVAKVVEFWGKRSVVGGNSLDGYVCVTLASRYPSSIKLLILMKFNVGLFLLLRLKFNFIVQFFTVVL